MHTLVKVAVFIVFFMAGPLGGPGAQKAGFGVGLSSPAMAAGAAITPAYEYVEMKPMVLPIITDKGVVQQVSLIVALEVPHGKKAEVLMMEPRLADAYLQDLYGALASGRGMTANNIIDVQAVKQRLTNVTHKVLTTEQVHDVLLQVLQQRRMM